MRRTPHLRTVTNITQALLRVLNGELNCYVLQEGSYFRGTGVQCSWDTFVIMGISECGPKINEHSWIE